MIAFLGELLRRWRMRSYDPGLSEVERLEQVRAYADWVRHPPPPPGRKVPEKAEDAAPVMPPVRGVSRYPGRRLLGG